MKIVRNLYYISIVTEILNIITYKMQIEEVAVPYSFMYARSIYDVVYTFFVLWMLCFTNRHLERCAFSLILLSIGRSLIWGISPVASIVDSMICIFILVFHFEKEIKEMGF